MLRILLLVSAISIALGGYSQNVPIHYWHFNTLPIGTLTTIAADQSVVGSPTITYPGTGAGYLDRVDDGTTLNALSGTLAGIALRVRNPSSTRTLQLALPTTGFGAIKFSYALKRTNSGAQSNSIEYRLSPSGTWQAIGTTITVSTVYVVVSIDFASVAGAENNQQFEVRINFGGANAELADGNNRIDNILLSGTPITGVNVPPVLLQAIPFVQAIAEGVTTEINLLNHFADPNSDPLTFTATSSNASIATAQVVGNTLRITPLRTGDATISLTATDGVTTPARASERVLVYPKAHSLSSNTYRFKEWGPMNPALTYPPSMIFLQSNVNDPVLNTPLLFAYNIPDNDYHEDDQATIGFPYNATRRTRIDGLGDRGISFINTGRGRDLGGALLALDTRGVTSAYINWQGSTLLQNVRICAIRLQYRTNMNHPFSNVLVDGSPVEYLVSSDGHLQVFPNIPLPSDALGKEYVQFLWRYYLVSGEADSRPQLGIRSITVTKDYSPFSVIFATICSGSSYSFGTSHLTESGNYTRVIQTPSGADSTVMLTLTVKEVDASVTSEAGQITAVNPNATYQWLDCGNSLAPITGQTQRSFTPTASGSFAVRVTEGDCSTVSSCVVPLGVGKAVSPEKNISIYPNPSRGSFVVSSQIEGSFIIVNSLGQVLERFTLTPANRFTKQFHSMGNGVYFIVGSGEAGTARSRVVVFK